MYSSIQLQTPSFKFSRNGRNAKGGLGFPCRETFVGLANKMYNPNDA